MTFATIATAAICAVATACVVARPFRWPEAVWAVAGGGLLLAFGLIAPARAWQAIVAGSDVYLFLIGMMLLSEVARAHGVFDWIAAWATAQARGSPVRLFGLVFGVGAIVTVFLSNDATAVVLTPAVYAAARRAHVAPLPLLFACAMVANAASFVLPISNPANLVLYGGAMPPLGAWLRSFALPSLVALAITYAMLRLVFRTALTGVAATDAGVPVLPATGRIALAGIGATAMSLLLASAREWPLGIATFAAGVSIAIVVQARARTSPWPLLRAIGWPVIALVAGLFVLVAALERIGLVDALARQLAAASAASAGVTAAAAGLLVAIVGNLVNNLPAGFVAARTIAAAHPPAIVVDAMLIGVDLGPNLSITGSLATILWLVAIRREGEDVGFLAFLKIGVVVMLPALVGAIATRLLLG